MDNRLPVEHIMRRDVVTLRKGSAVIEAALLMRAHKIGGIVIAEGLTPIGIITDKDLVIKVMALKKNPEKTKVEDVMSSPIISVDKDADMNEVAKIMAEHNIRRIVVKDKGKIAGIVTDKDILSVQPAMIDVLKEFLNVYGGGRDAKFKSKKGLCEVCDVFDNELVLVDERWMCPQCRKEVL